MFRLNPRSLTCFSSRVASTMAACLTQLPELASSPFHCRHSSAFVAYNPRSQNSGCSLPSRACMDRRRKKRPAAFFLSFFLCRLFPRFAASSVCLLAARRGKKNAMVRSQTEEQARRLREARKRGLFSGAQVSDRVAAARCSVAKRTPRQGGPAAYQNRAGSSRASAAGGRL
ncbi:hypothetical protein CCHR01_14055 [Colletotrichum chrysophilum]|uniref:Uncharacterized protein n=1 Tax=Colletotrichum chrysophilum TaxID=1836956 RepID=A0AAD9A8X9_9PEZI|nr:hypothetical protein CCHR01_14055 [Colletotrichum chrysophilum]